LSHSNPLKVGYIRIWGMNSSYVTQVCFTYDNQQFMETNFKSDPYNQVCLKGKLILLSWKIITIIVIVVLYNYIRTAINVCKWYVLEKLWVLDYVVKWIALMVCPYWGQRSIIGLISPCVYQKIFAMLKYISFPDYITKLNFLLRG
jgi:hypothetical protein